MCHHRIAMNFVCKLKAMNDYEKIEKAISYITDNFQQQPDLDEVAKQVHVSPWKFLQYTSPEYSKGHMEK